MDIRWDWKPVLIHFILYEEWAVFDFLTSTFSPYSVFSTNWPSDPFKIDTRSRDFSTENSSMSLTLQTVQARALAKVYRATRSGLSGLFLTLPCSVYSSPTGHTASQTQTAYSHLWTFALFVPFDRNTLPSDITWLISSPSSNLGSTVTISTGNPVQPTWNYIAPLLLTLPAPPCPILSVLHGTHHLLTFYIVYIFTMFIVSLPH